MKKFILTILLVLALPGLGFGYTETFYVCHGGDGSAPETDNCATAWDEADIMSSGNWAATDTDDTKVGQNDIVYFNDDGGDENLNPPGLKTGHDRFFFFTLHPPVNQSHLEFRKNIPLQMFGHLGGVF